MAAKDARDRGILNHFGILRSPTKAAPSFRAPVPIHVFKGASSGWDRPYVFGAQPDHRSVVVNCKPPHAGQELPGRVSVIVNCKPPHAGQELPGRVSVNANCKPPHAGQELPGRVSVIGDSIFEEGTKAEWFFDESRASVRQQWAAERKAARPQVRDQDFLAKKHGERRSIDMFTDMFA